MAEDHLHELLRFGKRGPGRKSWRCSDLTALAAYADGKLQGKAEFRFERHLADCDYCLSELALLVRAQESTQECEVSLEVLARARSFAETKSIFGLKPAWGWTAISAAAVLSVLFVSLEIREPRVIPSLPIPAAAPSHGTSAPPPAVEPSTPAPPSVRNSQQNLSAPELIFPSEGAIVPPGDLEFRWNKVNGSIDYDILVATIEGDIVWEGRTENTHARLPHTIRLTPDQKYFVWVRADLPEGKAVKSRAISFRARNQ